ncbi:MAG: hypothetical protein HFH46_00850 [Bacilli bacterium]|nr:hypothetical protein [Bacilli bacterium]
MKNKFDKNPSTLSILSTFVLLVVAIFGYVLVNKYITASPTQKIENIEEETKGKITEKDALKIAKEKYYMAVATITNTKSDMDKLYNQIETTDLVLTDKKLIESLNKFNLKTYSENSAISVIKNYTEAIKDNFTDSYINNYILYPKGFVGNVGNEYYIIKEKIDNYFFKEATFNLISKNEKEMNFTVVNTNYDSSCASEGQTIPSITCTDTKDSDKTNFKLIKEDDIWKISEIQIKTS